MILRSGLIATLAFLILIPRLAAQSGPRLAIPKGMPVELALELLGKIGDFAITLEGRFKDDSSAVKLHSPRGPSLSYAVPASVEVSGSEDVSGLPLTRIQVTVAVRCICIVSYDIKKILIDGRELVLPVASVVPAYADPPGERGRWTSNASFFRWKSSPSIDALKAKLLDEALVEAKRQYLHADHATYESQWTAAVQAKLVSNAQQHMTNNRHDIAGNSEPSGHQSFLSVIAIILSVCIIVAVYSNSRRRFGRR
jgi:hypothetical protein